MHMKCNATTQSVHGSNECNGVFLRADVWSMCLLPSPCPAYVELPDGKVISGTEWGNFLLWDGGFIKVEIAKKGKKMCHHVRSLRIVCVCACMRACACACVCVYAYVQ